MTTPKFETAVRNSTTRAHTQAILELFVCGLTRRQIMDHIQAKTEWGKATSTRSFDRLIARAKDLLEKEAKPVRARELGKAIRRLDMLFARCMQITDYKGALAVERQRIELLNLTHTWPMTPVRATAAPAVTPAGPVPVRREALEPYAARTT